MTQSNIGKEIKVVKHKWQLVELLTKILRENISGIWSVVVTEVFDYGIELDFEEALAVINEYYRLLLEAISTVEETLVTDYKKLEGY